MPWLCVDVVSVVLDVSGKILNLSNILVYIIIIITKVTEATNACAMM